MSTEELLRSQLEEARAELEALRSKVEEVKECLTSRKFWEGRTVDAVEVADFVLVRLAKVDWPSVEIDWLFGD